MNDNSIMNGIFRTGVWGVVIVATMIFFCVLVAPVFLPIIRNIMENRYKDFTYKEDLIAEEMRRYRIITWTMCMLAWIAFIAYSLVVGL